MPTVLESYAFVHLFLAHAADGVLGDDEVAVATNNLFRMAQALGHGRTATEEVAHAVLDDYAARLEHGGPGAVVHHYKQCVNTLVRAVADDVLAQNAIEEDLMAMADADGTIDNMETFLIRDIVGRWQAHHA